MNKKMPMLNLKRKVGEVVAIEINGKICRIMISDIVGQVCNLTFKAPLDFNISREGVDESIIEATIERRENKIIRKSLKSKSSLSNLMATSTPKEGCLSFGEYRNRNIRSVPSYYLDYHLDKPISTRDREIILMEKKRRKDCHKKED